MKKEVKRTLRHRAITPSKAKAPTIEQLRLSVPHLPGFSTNKHKAMMLVNDILNPDSGEEAALSLMILVTLIAETHNQTERFRLGLSCDIQALLYTEEWKANLDKLKAAMKVTRGDRIRAKGGGR